MRLIYADALKELFEKNDDLYRSQDIRHVIDYGVPTVDPVRHGHWVEDDSGRLFNDHYCSLCKHYALRDNLGFECLTDWCPGCGAKMDEEVR